MITYAQNLPSPSFMPNYTPLLDFKKLLHPISALESKLLDQLEFKIGLNWGVPRFGHPEGKVGLHILEVLENIKQVNTSAPTYQRLRITAFAHDTFKYKEAETKLNGKKINHGLIARRFMEKFIDDEITLSLIELHDEIFFAWRYEALEGKPEKAEDRLNRLISRIGEDQLQLHYLFFRCDTMTGDKIQAPRLWFEQKVIAMGCPKMIALINQLNANA